MYDVHDPITTVVWDIDFFFHPRLFFLSATFFSSSATLFFHPRLCFFFSEISVNCKLKILAKRVSRLKGIGSLKSEKSSFSFFIQMLLNFPAISGTISQTNIILSYMVTSTLLPLVKLWGGGLLTVMKDIFHEPIASFLESRVLVSVLR